MTRPAMNMQKVEQCMKRGKSRAACMKEVYPDKGGSTKEGDAGGKKKPSRSRRSSY